MSLSDSKVVKVEPLAASDARWIQLVKITYDDPNGTTRSWESAERKTRPTASDADAVALLAILEKPTGTELLLVKQFRPPTGKVTIELPAGLIDVNESAQAAAERELLEETGYVGTATEISPVWCSSPGLTNANLRLVQVSVDMSRVENQNPQPKPEESEFIDVFSVPLASLWETIAKLDAEGFAIDALLGSLAKGFELASRISH